MSALPDSNSALIEARSALRAGHRNPPMIEISRDPREAVAYALEVIRSSDRTIDKGEALDQLANRIDRFIDADSDDALRELAATMPIMEALFIRYSMEAAETSNVERKYRLTKIALQCQSSFARTLALIAGLKQQRKGKATITINDD